MLGNGSGFGVCWKMFRVLSFVGKWFEFWRLLKNVPSFVFCWTNGSSFVFCWTNGSSSGFCWTNGSSFGFGGSSVSFSHSDIIRFGEDIMTIIVFPINVNIKIGDGAFLDLRVIHSLLIFFA